MEDLTFKTNNEDKEYSKPKIESGQYEFKIVDIKPSSDKSKNFFILEIEGQEHEGKPVALVWSAPTNEEYSPGTNFGKLMLSVGFEMGGEVKGSSLINLKGQCIVQDYTKQIQVNGKNQVITYSVIGDLVIPETEEVEVEETTDTED